MLADVRGGGRPAPRRLTVEAFLIEAWLPAKRSTLKPTTFASYRDLVTAQVVPRIGHVRLVDIDGAELNTFYGELLAGGRRDGRGGLSAKTVRNIDGVLNKAFRDAVRWGRLVRNPCDAADPPRKPTPELAVWSEDELGAFLGAARADRLWATWMLVATTGMRRGELCGLRWADIDLDAGRLTVRQTRTLADHEQVTGSPKTAAGARTIALHPEAVAALRSWRKVQLKERLAMGAGWADTGLVVTEATGVPIHPAAPHPALQRPGGQARAQVCRLHDVRHAYATAALRAGVPVKVLSERLGHSNVTVTMGIYQHVTQIDDEGAAVLAATGFLGGAVTNL